MDNADHIGRAFAQHYYSTFSANRPNLSPLYSDFSCMTFEGQPTLGTQNIMKKLESLPFKCVQHSVTTCDSQFVYGVDAGRAVVVTVMGRLQTDDDPPKDFIQTFFLRAVNDSYMISNETFRLVLHNQ
ncbi:nuclear transport factor 2-like [Styela clava]